jgi:peptide-methionine (S)-S-oxide reductase
MPGPRPRAGLFHAQAPTGIQSLLMKPVTRLLAGALAMMMGASCSPAAGGGGAELPAPQQDIPLAEEPQKRTAVLASGCFWCTEVVFQQIPGVLEVVSGYAGDTREKATYQLVSGGQTKHAECVQVTYDASQISYGRLLQIFFATHDPTTLNRQGPDTGTQYRSAIFYADEQQKQVAEAYVRQLGEAKAFAGPIVTTLEPLNEFYAAEAYHQDYAKLNPFQPYIQRYALPKARKAREQFGEEKQ